MFGIKYLPKDLDIEGKSLIVRLDLNVPLKDGKIQDHTRILLALPLLRNLIKRKAKVEDTSDLLPGHGGFLDRVDGIIFAIPVGFLILNYL